MLFKFLSFFEHIDKYVQNRNKREIYMLYFSIVLALFCGVFMWLEPIIAINFERNKQAFDNVSQAFIKNQASLKNTPLNPQNSIRQAISEKIELDRKLQAFRIFLKNHYDLLEEIYHINTELNLNTSSDILIEGDEITLSVCGDFENLAEFIRRIELNHFVFLQDFRLSILDDTKTQNCKKENNLFLWLSIKNLGVFL